jgi:hypothetical protein
LIAVRQRFLLTRSWRSKISQLREHVIWTSFLKTSVNFSVAR